MNTTIPASNSSKTPIPITKALEAASNFETDHGDNPATSELQEKLLEEATGEWTITYECGHSETVEYDSIEEVIEHAKYEIEHGDYNFDNGKLEDGVFAIQKTYAIHYTIEDEDGELTSHYAEVEQDEPEPPIKEGWDFVNLTDAGLSDFDHYNHGGTDSTYKEVCRNTGIYRLTYDPGSQGHCDEPTQIVTYLRADQNSINFVLGELEDLTNEDAIRDLICYIHEDTDVSVSFEFEKGEPWWGEDEDEDSPSCEFDVTVELKVGNWRLFRESKQIIFAFTKYTHVSPTSYVWEAQPDHNQNPLFDFLLLLAEEISGHTLNYDCEAPEQQIETA